MYMYIFHVSRRLVPELTETSNRVMNENSLVFIGITSYIQAVVCRNASETRRKARSNPGPSLNSLGIIGVAYHPSARETQHAFRKFNILVRDPSTTLIAIIEENLIEPTTKIFRHIPTITEARENFPSLRSLNKSKYV